jgi:hypothetical protein
MSGEKRVTIRSSEYDRLRLAETQLRIIQADLPEVLVELRRESAADLQRQLEPLDRRQQALARHMDTMQEQLTTLAADQRRKTDLAEAWIETAEALGEFLKAHYPHQQFSPGRVAAITQGIGQARENVSQGMTEAAISAAQHAHQQLSDLRQSLETQERAWCVRRQAARDAARALLTVAEKSRQCEAVDLQGRNVGVPVEVNWWTDNKLHTLEHELTGLIDRIENASTPLTTAELQAVETQTVPALRQRLEQAVQEARLRVLGSQLRINIADLVVQALEEKGFTVQDGTYEGEDMRKGYAAKVTHLDGSEVVVLITPAEGEPGKNEMRIHSYDAAQLSDHELRQRTTEINHALRERGLEVSEPQEAAAQADPALRDLARLRQRRPAPQHASVGA